jgi:accessory gene regulator B
MIEYIVNKITFQIIRKEIVSEEDEPVIRYGLQAMMEVSIILATILLISVAFGQMVEAAAWLGTVILCRSFGRGYHAKTFISCYFISVTIFVLTLLTVNGMPYRLFLSVVMVCSMISATLFLYFSIITRKKMEIGDRNVYDKVGTAIHLCYYGFLVSMILWGNVNSIVMASLFGFIVSQLSILIKSKGGVKNEAC